MSSDNKELQKEQLSSEENMTIMPTMIDESEMREERKVDLSAIIPKFEDSSNSESAIELSSKENTLKSDGAILIALVDGDGQARVTSNAGLPGQIDIEERKKEQQKRKSGKKKVEKVKKNKKAVQKFQNHMALFSLIVIILLGGFYYWYKKHPTDKDFTVLPVTVEIGDKLPSSLEAYVKPGVGTFVDGLLYQLDLDNVVLEEPGDYPFTVTYKGVVKTGTLSIVDRTPPELEIRNVSIVEGTSYDASNFVETCKDNSGCNFSFQDADTTKKYNTSGVYVVYVVATDAFGNSVTKRANLVIEAKGDVVTYLKNTSFNFDTGCETTDSYELHFSSEVLINGTRQIISYYQSDEKYNEVKKEHAGDANYSFDDSQKTTIYKVTLTTVGSNYSSLEHIDDYLKQQGYSKIE